jgi:hypothetical protein
MYTLKSVSQYPENNLKGFDVSFVESIEQFGRIDI